MNYWIFSNKPGEYGDSQWSTQSILDSRRWYFPRDLANVGKVKDGDRVICRSYGEDYFAEFVVKGPYKAKGQRGIVYFRMTKIKEFSPPLPQELIRKELSNRAAINRIISVEKSDFEKIYMAQRIFIKLSASGKFPGAHCINHRFKELAEIFKVAPTDWRSSLGDLQGVYLITDLSNGKRYVGSASGNEGIWYRWSSYLETGHGGNRELKRLIRRKGMEYARKNFCFSILEAMAKGTLSSDEVKNRESHWKEVLLSRESEYGYNKN